MRRISRLSAVVALLALLMVPGTAAATDRPWWADAMGDGPCTLEALIVTDLAVADGGLSLPDLILDWAVRDGYRLTPEGILGPDGTTVPVPANATLGSCPVELVPGLAVRVAGAFRGGGAIGEPGGGVVGGTRPPLVGPIESPEQAWEAVVIFDPRFAGIGPLDRDMIGASAWYEVASTKDLPTSQYFVTITVGWGDCQAGCIERHTWRFTVGRDASIVLDADEGPVPPPDVFPGAGAGNGAGDCIPPRGGMDGTTGSGECPNLGGPIKEPPPGSIDDAVEMSQASMFEGPWGVLVVTFGAGLGVLGLAAIVARHLARRAGSPEG
jgi:hypothetical protein